MSNFNRNQKRKYNEIDHQGGSPSMKNYSYDDNQGHYTGTNRYSEKAAKIMRLMGHKDGVGLGKERQGIVEPIQVQERKNRRGLGHETRISDEEPIPKYLEWNIKEEVKIKETVEWIPLSNNESTKMPSREVLQSWLVTGPKKLIIEDETNFVEPIILKYILVCKSALDEFTDSELFKARSRSNPYETIRKGIFINRAAMKMANIDTVLNFEITCPKKLYGDEEDSEDLQDVIKEEDLLYFADICAGPGGFTEYILWKKKWEAKGFGFTLKGEWDFKLNDFIVGPTESFEPHYGAKGQEGDGDIYNPENCQSFIDYVLKNSDVGVHFVMADGGFSVAGQENIQEILSRQLYLSQAMVALSIIRQGGHFICKLFDVFTPFSVGLVYLMRYCFHKVSLLKPNTSRPANSERYLICKWRKDDIQPVIDYLKDCHTLMWSWKDQPKTGNGLDILEIVPLDFLKSQDDPFFQYIWDGNNQTGIRQIQNLRKIVAYFGDWSLREERQHEIREKSLDYWQIPKDRLRMRDFNVDPNEKFQNLLRMTHCSNTNLEKNFERDLTPTLRANEFRSPFNWKCCAVENGKFKKNRGLFLSSGRTQIYKYDSSRSWIPLDYFTKFQMANDTLIYGEIVNEYEGKFPNQKKTTSLHIIDALILGGKDVRCLPIMERNAWCLKFAKSMNKTFSVSGYGSLRGKELTPLEEFKSLHAKLIKGQIIGGGKIEKLLIPVKTNPEIVPDSDRNPTFIEPKGILFLREIIDPYLVAISRTHEKKYYFNIKNGDKTFEIPPNAISDFVLTNKSRIFWEWDSETDLSYPPKDEAQFTSGKVHVQELIEYIFKIERDGVK